MRAVQQGLKKAGEQGKGSKSPDDNVSLGSAQDGARTISIGNGSLTASVGPNGEISIGGVAIPGRYDSATQSVVGPHGVVDLKSAQINRNGVTFLQTDRGVLIIPPGTLIVDATLNKDGTIRFKNGTTASLDAISVTPDRQIAVNSPGMSPYTINPATGLPEGGGAARGGQDPSTVSGRPPGQLIGANGQPVTIDGDAPPFQNGMRSFVRRTYIGARDTILQREVKVTQRLLEASGTNWRVDESLGESRTWTLKIDLRDTQSGSGRLTGTMVVVDAGGATGISVSSLEVQDDAGQQASVQRGAAPGSYAVAFSKSGDYTARAEGSTDWGSRFRLESTFPIGVR